MYGVQCVPHLLGAEKYTTACTILVPTIGNNWYNPFIKLLYYIIMYGYIVIITTICNLLYLCFII